MGIFGRRQSREERAAEIAGKVASGKGFYGRLTRATLGAQDFAKVQQSLGAYNSGVTVQQLLAAGAPTIKAAVVSVADTGRLINFDPIVDLIVQPVGDTAPIYLQTLVSKLEIPRAGDHVLLVADPAQPGNHLYAGVAPAA